MHKIYLYISPIHCPQLICECIIYKVIKDTRIKILAHTSVSSTKDSLVTLETKQNIKKAKQSTKLKSIENQKFLKVLPKTAKVIYIIIFKKKKGIPLSTSKDNQHLISNIPLEFSVWYVPLKTQNHDPSSTFERPRR